MPDRPPLHTARVVGVEVHDTPRPTAAVRGYDARWRRARLIFLREHPLCAGCAREGRLEGAGVVDHIRPHNGNALLFWDIKNWQPLCKRCHDRKTATERKHLK